LGVELGAVGGSGSIVRNSLIDAFENDLLDIHFATTFI
jgi:hypothetical protein